MFDPNSNRGDPDLEGRYAGYTGRSMVQSWLTVLIALIATIVILVIVGVVTGRL